MQNAKCKMQNLIGQALTKLGRVMLLLPHSTRQLGELHLNNIPNTETLSVRVWQCQTLATGDTIFEQLPWLKAGQTTGYNRPLVSN
jgi:hypothetical protein